MATRDFLLEQICSGDIDTHSFQVSCQSDLLCGNERKGQYGKSGKIGYNE